MLVEIFSTYEEDEPYVDIVQVFRDKTEADDCRLRMLTSPENKIFSDAPINPNNFQVLTYEDAE